MKKQNNSPTAGAKHANDPSKNDPTKKDERDNDATRIKTEKPANEQPQTPQEETINRSIEEPGRGKPYEREPKHKPEPVEEPGKEQGSGINKDYNPASPVNKENDTTEKDDAGNVTLKRFGRGL